MSILVNRLNQGTKRRSLTVSRLSTAIRNS